MNTLASLFLWLDTSAQLVQRMCVVVSLAFVAFRAEWLRRALRGASVRWKDTCVVIVVFGLLAILGSHGGIVVDVHRGVQAAGWPESLREEQAIINFRDCWSPVPACSGGSGQASVSASSPAWSVTSWGDSAGSPAASRAH